MNTGYRLMLNMYSCSVLNSNVATKTTLFLKVTGNAKGMLQTISVPH